jgi:alpha-1,6-mannosyltransferase
MHPEKRLGALFDAFAEARRDIEMGLVVYGDGPMRDFVRRHARRVPNVHLAGYTSEPNELPEVYASADALLHASAAETYGLVVAEALCSGTPVIVPDVGGAADLAQPAWAETWPPGDVAAGANAIRRMMARDRSALRDACADAAASHITTMDDHFVALFELYADLVARG